MKTLLSSRSFFFLGFILIAAANSIVLFGVASNRSGASNSQIRLTERELQLPYHVNKENSGLALRLTFRTLGGTDDDIYYYSGRTPAWLTAEKLKKLGFNIDAYESPANSETWYKHPIPKEVFLVLENDGESYRQAVNRAEADLKKKEQSFKLHPDDKKYRDDLKRAEKRVKNEHMKESRLFAIDAGLKPGELRNRYGDQRRYIITKGLIKARYSHHKGKKKIFGYISKLSVANIHVPLKHRKIFDSIIREKSKKNDFKVPRFEVELAYGSRFEPWMVSAEMIK